MDCVPHIACTLARHAVGLSAAARAAQYRVHRRLRDSRCGAAGSTGRAVADGPASSRVRLALGGERTQRIEVPGIAVPGWVDAHVHISGLGSTLETLNVERMSKEAIAKAVADVAQKRRPATGSLAAAGMRVTSPRGRIPPRRTSIR